MRCRADDAGNRCVCWHDTVLFEIEHASQMGNIVILLVLVVIFYLACMRRLEKYEAI